MRTVLKLVMRVAVIAFSLALLFVFAAHSRAQNGQLPSSADEKPGEGEPVYRTGADVAAPRAIYAPDPEYSEEARIAELQGTCVRSVVVGADGHPHDVRVDRSLGMGLDENPIEAIRTWRFDPARKDGQPVAVQINVETVSLWTRQEYRAYWIPFSQMGQSPPNFPISMLPDTYRWLK